MESLEDRPLIHLEIGDEVASDQAVAVQRMPWGHIATGSTMLTAACGGGGTPSASGTQPSSSSAPSSAPFSVQGLTPSKRAIARSLLQVTFGISTTLVDQVEKEGFSAWLDRQMPLPNEGSSVDFFSTRGLDNIDTNAHFRNELNLDAMIWSQLFSQGNQLRKRMAFALSQIFVVSIVGLDLPWRPQAVGAFWDLLNAHAFGNYRDLLEAVTLSPAMGAYLNMRGSQASDLSTGRVPDENYAREVLQLFSIGLVVLNIDGTPKLNNGAPSELYSNADIEGLAKVFTGFNLDYSGVKWNPSPVPGPEVPDVKLVRQPMTSDFARWSPVGSRSLHSTDEKRFLGITIPAGTGPVESLKRALDAIAGHPNVGPFISKQLIQRLVSSNPSPAYVARVATVFNNNGKGVRGDLAAVFKAIVLDAEATDPATALGPFAGKLREPVMRFAQWGRTFNATSSSGGWSIRDLSPDYLLNQAPFRSPSVFNFFRPDFVSPRTQAFVNNMVAPEFQIANDTTVAGYVNFVEGVLSDRAYWYADIKADYKSFVDLATEPSKLLDALDLVLTGGQLGTFARSTILSVIEATPITSSQDQDGKLSRVLGGIALVMSSNDYLVQK